MAAVQATAKLYGTGFCHLCAEAEAILDTAKITAMKIDIAEDDILIEQYSLRIPVLKRIDNDAELDWPFDAAAVSHFLK